MCSSLLQKLGKWLGCSDNPDFEIESELEGDIETKKTLLTQMNLLNERLVEDINNSREKRYILLGVFVSLATWMISFILQRWEIIIDQMSSNKGVFLIFIGYIFSLVSGIGILIYEVFPKREWDELEFIDDKENLKKLCGDSNDHVTDEFLKGLFKVYNANFRKYNKRTKWLKGALISLIISIILFLLLVGIVVLW